MHSSSERLLFASLKTKGPLCFHVLMTTQDVFEDLLWHNQWSKKPCTCFWTICSPRRRQTPVPKGHGMKCADEPHVVHRNCPTIHTVH